MKLAGIAKITYYYHLKAKNTDKYANEKTLIKSIFKENKGSYGYRIICLVLKQQGVIINHKTVLKLMRSLSLEGKQRKRKYGFYKGKVGKIAENLLNRDFNSLKPYEKLETDVTEFSICNEKVYLSPVIDMFNNEIISYSISKSPNFCQIKEMLKNLTMVLPTDAKPRLHSDQGLQYQMKEFQRFITDNGIIQSM